MTVRFKPRLMAPLLGAFSLLCAAPSPAQSSAQDSQLSLLLRVQPELVYVDGRAADAAGTDGFEVTDGWGAGRSNTLNWGGFFINGSHAISDQTRAFVRVGFNIDAEGLKDGDSKNRQVYAGIDTAVGEFSAGRIQTAYKAAGLGWDPLNATFLQARGNGGRSGGALGHGAQFDRSVTYRQNFGGASIRVMASLDDDVASDATGDDDHLTSASIHLPAGPIELIGAYLDASGYEGGPDDRDALKLGARYSEGAWSGALMHERRGEGLENGNFTFLSGSYKQGDWRFMANLGLFSDDDNANDGEYFALAARYELHNMVSVHGGVRQLDRDITGKERVAGLGLRIRLNSGNLLN